MIYEIRCNNCYTYFESGEDLEHCFDEKTQEYCNGCPKCKTDEYLMSMNDDVFFDCSLHESPRTLDWCEKNCPRYFSCDTVAEANDRVKELYG